MDSQSTKHSDPEFKFFSTASAPRRRPAAAPPPRQADAGLRPACCASPKRSNCFIGESEPCELTKQSSGPICHTDGSY